MSIISIINIISIFGRVCPDRVWELSSRGPRRCVPAPADDQNNDTDNNNNNNNSNISNLYLSLSLSLSLYVYIYIYTYAFVLSGESSHHGMRADRREQVHRCIVFYYRISSLHSQTIIRTPPHTFNPLPPSITLSYRTRFATGGIFRRERLREACVLHARSLEVGIFPKAPNVPLP